jgi:hypothetical protein
MRWQPITDRRLRGRAGRAIRELAAILAEPVAAASASLALGDAGTAVFFAYLARARFPVKHAVDRAQLYAGRAAQAVADKALPLGLFGGIAGIAWMLDHLRGAERRAAIRAGELTPAARRDRRRRARARDRSGARAVRHHVYTFARRDRALAGRVVARPALFVVRTAMASPGREAPRSPGTRTPRRAGRDARPGARSGIRGFDAVAGARGLLGHARWGARRWPALPAPVCCCRRWRCAGDGAAGDARLAVLRRHMPRARADAAEATGDAAVRGRGAWSRCGGARAGEPGRGRPRYRHGAAGVAFGLQRMFVASGEHALRDAAGDWLAGALDEGVPAGLRDGSDAANGRGLLGGAGLGLAYLAAMTSVWPRWASALTIVPAISAGRRR